MCDNAVDLILYVFVLCENFSFLYLLNDSIDKVKPLSVSRLYCRLVFEIDIRLYIGSFLSLSA